jgi:amino-acid N-acetyltransferase
MIRKAHLADAVAIHKLVNSLAQKGLMLPRPLSEIYENIRDYFVMDKGRGIMAVAGLHVNWEDLAEIKSVAVEKRQQGKGLGRAVVQACLDEGAALGVKRFYALTYVPDFFKKMGFRRIDRAVLPHKVWTECVKCPKFPDCDEIAMLREVGLKKKKK